MKQHTFELQFRQEWEIFEHYLDIQESKNRKKNHPAVFTSSEFPEHYRTMCHLLSIAKERNYSYFLIDQLNNLVLRGHQHLYLVRKSRVGLMGSFFTQGFPRLIRKEWKLLCLSLALFYVTAFVMVGVASVFPEVVHSVFTQPQINQFESMYDPNAHHVGKTRESDTDLYMFGYYIAHNTTIAFQTFAGGILLGVGTIFYLINNGVVMGAITAHLQTVGFSSTFYPFIIGHSAFELTAIILSGVAGLKLGFSLIAPGRRTRIDALRHAAQVSIKMIFGVSVMLLLAAFIEAFWSSSTTVTANNKYIVGAGLWGVVISYFLFSGRTREF